MENEYESVEENNNFGNENTNVKGFSVSWQQVPNAKGVKPPHPQFQPDNLPPTVVPVTTTKYGSMPIGLIQSARQPYAEVHAYTKYGELQTKLGTNLGT
jgi:hypothetical protein